MTQSKHTPGRALAPRDYMLERRLTRDGSQLPLDALRHIERVHDVADFYARRGGAAPDLLEATKEALGWMVDNSVEGDQPDTLRAAIAKATGGADAD